MLTLNTHGLSSAGVPASTGPFSALVIGASFGGPQAVRTILAELPADFALPVAVCQHMVPGFTEQWAQQLDAHCRLRVREATDRADFEAGSVYIAPIGMQLHFAKGPRGTRLRLMPDSGGSLHVPSVDEMMISAAKVFGSRTLAVLLTGLGEDGTQGMLAVRHAGGYTIAQSCESSASYSMPGAAAHAGAVVEQLDIARIAARVTELGAVEPPRGRAR